MIAIVIGAYGVAPSRTIFMMSHARVFLGAGAYALSNLNMPATASLDARRTELEASVEQQTFFKCAGYNMSVYGEVCYSDLRMCQIHAVKGFLTDDLRRWGIIQRHEYVNATYCGKQIVVNCTAAHPHMPSGLNSICVMPPKAHGTPWGCCMPP